MKRVLLSFVFLFSIITLGAQDLGPAKTLNYNTLERKYEKSNEDIKHHRRKDRARTWLKRGELMQDIHDVNIELLRLGMPETELQLLRGEPNETKTVQEGGRTREIHVYEHINIILENGQIIDWEETDKIVENPLELAIEAYDKTLELDDRGRFSDDVKENLDRLKGQAEFDGIMAFNDRNFEQALASFELIMQASDFPVYDNYVDTVIVYNAALAATNAEMHDKAIKYYEKAIDVRYGGTDAYFLLKREYLAKKDSSAAINTLLEGFEAYPDSTALLIDIVNYYLTTGNAEAGIKYLQEAKKRESENASMYFAEGTLYEKLDKPKPARESYQKAIEMDPDYFNAWYNIGALEYNKAVEMYDSANAIQDLDEYNMAKKMADEQLKKAIEPMEKAHALKPEEVTTLETLKTVYYRLQMDDKYEEVNQKLKELKGQQ